MRAIKDKEPIGYEIYRSSRELVSVLGKEVFRLLPNEKDEDKRVLEEYRQYRETYGR